MPALLSESVIKTLLISTYYKLYQKSFGVSSLFNRNWGAGNCRWKMLIRELFRGRGSLNGRFRGTCTRNLLKVSSIRYFLWLAIPFQNVGIHHFETLPILPNCILSVSAILILRMADFIFFMEGNAVMKRLSASHDASHNMKDHLDRH